MKDEAEEIHSDDTLYTKCVYCSSQSFLIDIFLVLDEEYFSFKCLNEKCSKIFAMDYNSYIYDNWNVI